MILNDSLTLDLIMDVPILNDYLDDFKREFRGVFYMDSLDDDRFPICSCFVLGGYKADRIYHTIQGFEYVFPICQSSELLPCEEEWNNQIADLVFEDELIHKEISFQWKISRFFYRVVSIPPSPLPIQLVE